jgi:hypothetical protein
MVWVLLDASSGEHSAREREGEQMIEKVRSVSSPEKALVFLLTLLLIGATSRVAAAQQLGVRTGVSGDPGQFYLGGHVETGPVLDSLWFRPNLELGLGHDTTLTTINMEFAYKIAMRGKSWRPYIGGGPAFILARHNGDTDAGGGFNLLFGAEHRGGLFAEVKAGFVDSPGFKFGIGYTFKNR